MWPFSKKVALKPIVVEEYQIEEVTDEGFKKLYVKFADVDGRKHLFEFQPNYAHHFSDALVKYAARALAPKS